MTGVFGQPPKDDGDALQMIADGGISVRTRAPHRRGLGDVDRAFPVAESGAATKPAISDA